MLRTALLFFALAVSPVVAGCIDDDSPEPEGERGNDDDPDVTEPGDDEDDTPTSCHELQDSDDPDCAPPPKG